MSRPDDLPLGRYAIVGDGVTAALVADDGAVDWLCHGRFDGPAVFCRLLDRERGGYLQVAPDAPGFRATRTYAGDTNVLETRLDGPTGAMRVTDCMPLGTDGSMLLRKLEGLAGEVPVRVEFVPTFDFARAGADIERTAGGCVARAADRCLRLACPPPLTVGQGRATGSFGLAAGETRWVVLTHGAPAPDGDAAEAALRATVAAWEDWIARGRFPGRHAHLLRRSALAMKALIHASTGAMVAAPTTSLPESPGGCRNWDYRFTWLRDSSWVVSALMDLGYHDESMAFIGWLEGLHLDGARHAVCYDLDGCAPSEERVLHHLRGYGDARPVRVGNAAAAQDQHDVFGEVIAAVHMCSEAMPEMRPLEPRLWRLVTSMADEAAAHWRHGDAGIWEMRSPPRHFLASKLLCWTALDRALAMARRDGLPGPVERWAAERARLRDAILAEGFHPGVGAFTMALGDDALDATALLLPRYGLLPATDPRVVRTVDRVRERLSAGRGLLRRYVAPDGLPGEEGAFIACSFWLVECLARQGRLDEARDVFEQAAACGNDVGLLSEEVWPGTGELLGNFPQSFSHLALIQAAVALADAEAGIPGDRPKGCERRDGP